MAQEVRALAQRCSEAAGSIKDLVMSSGSAVRDGVALVADTNSALGDIATKVAEVAGIVESIAGAAREQSTGLSEVSKAVAQMDDLTQRNSTMVDQTSMQTRQLKTDAAALLAALDAFSSGARPRPARAA